MNQKTALCIALLRGDILNIKTGFTRFGVTNLPREISRSIEDEARGGFGVIVLRKKQVGKTRFGTPCVWFDYHLPKSKLNASGRKKMYSYVKLSTKK